MKKLESGFTVVETLVTLIVAVVLVVAINTLFVTVIRSTASARNRANASTLAYTYLRTYAYPGASTTWFGTCDATKDMQQNASAPGVQPAGSSGSLDASQTTLPLPVTYTVVGLAPYGCVSPNDKSPLLVRATITYGPDNLTVTHATYLEQAL